MKKRILSMLLCVMMVVTAIPMALVPAVAADDVAEAAAPTITYDDLYVDDATYKWDAFDLTAGDSVTSFANTVGTTNLSMKGTVEAGKYVHSNTPLKLGGLFSQYLSEDGNNYYFCEDTTIEIVLQQYWTDEIAESFSTSQCMAGWNTSSLIKRNAEATAKVGRLEWKLQVPSEGNKYPGYIKNALIARVNPATPTKSSNWHTDDVDGSNGQFYANELNEPYAIGFTFDFDCENEQPQFVFGIHREETGVHATASWVYYPTTNKQTLELFQARMHFGYYAIRAYKKVLNVAEMQQNHFADLAKYFAISDTALLSLETLPEEYILELHTAFTAVNFNDTDKDAFEAAIAAKQAEYDAYLAEQEALRYQTLIDALYVDGANFMWDAFDMTAEDEVITTLENRVGTKNIALKVAVEMGDGYIKAPQSKTALIDLREGASSLIPTKTVGTRYLPDDYTIEMTVHQHWDESYVTTKAAFGNVDIRWQIAGFGTGSSWGGQFNFTLQTPDATKGYIKSQSTYFAKMNDDGTLYDHWGNTNNWSTIFVSELEKPYSFGWTTVSDFPEGATYYPTQNVPFRDGELLTSLTRNHYMRQVYYDSLGGDGKFQIGTATPFAYYSFRIYPFALDAEQVAQNHFAELCDYFNVPLETLEKINALDVDVKKALDVSFNGKTFADYADVDALALAIDEELAEMALAEYRALLKTLYVDGATYMWDAYAAKAGDKFTSFKNAVGTTDIAMSGTAGNKFVRSQAELNLSALIPNYTKDGLVMSEDVTFELVMHQHWDEEFATYYNNLFANDLAINESTGKANNPNHQRFAWNNTLIKRYSESAKADGALEWRTQDPNAEGNKYPGYINFAQMVKVTPDATVYNGNTLLNFNTDNTAGSVGQFYANELNEPFAIAYTFKFDCENAYPQFDLGLYRADTGVNAVATTKYWALSTAQQFRLFNAEMAFGYYAIRAYDRVLSETELQQNHFADLANYFEISVEMIDLLKATPAEKLAAFYAAYDEVNFNDMTAEEFGASITANLAAVDAAIVKGEAAKNSFITFDGYQVRTNGYAGIRSRYTIALDAIVEGATLVEVGAIMAIATEGRTTADLTVVKTADGYTATGKQMMNAAVEEKDIFTDETGAHFAYTLTFQNEASQTKTSYETEIMFRGYVVLEIDGFEYVYYTDMTSGVFGDTISMLEASQHEAFKDFETSLAVIAACKTN